MKEDILTQITANKRKEISRQTEAVSMKQLEAIIAMHETREPLSLSRSVMSSPTGIISEFKRRSPSKGWINREADTPISLEAAKATSSKPAFQPHPPLY